MNTKAVVIGVVSGVAVGVVLGILFAPDKGSVTRQKWARKPKELKDAMDNRMDHLAETAQKQMDKVKTS